MYGIKEGEKEKEADKKEFYTLPSVTTGLGLLRVMNTNNNNNNNNNEKFYINKSVNNVKKTVKQYSRVNFNEIL